MFSVLLWSLTLALLVLEEMIVGSDAPAQAQRLVFLSVLLVAFVSAEIMRVRRANPGVWLLDPAVLCSLSIFLLAFGLTNVLYFLPPETQWRIGLTPGVTPWMNRLMVLVLIGAIAMWAGYRAPLGPRIGAGLKSSRWLEGALRRDFEPRTPVVIALFAIGVVSRLLAIHFGVYWYSGSLDALREAAPFQQYLTIGEEASVIALVLVALQYFSPGAPARTKWWLIGILGVELFFGFLSGMKSQVVDPLIIVGACQYLRTRRLPWAAIALFPLTVVIAYAVIEPYRAAKYFDPKFSAGSVSELTASVVRAVGDGTNAIEERPDPLLATAARMNLSYIGSLGIEFADSRELPPGSPAFLKDIILAPLYAVMPRVLWESKTSAQHGRWYLWEVMGSRLETTSVGMGPVTYLYFAGGALAVAIGFFAVGIVQRVVREVFLGGDRAGHALMFLMLLGPATNIDSVFYTVIISLIRMVPAAFAVQYAAFRR